MIREAKSKRCMELKRIFELSSSLLAQNKISLLDNSLPTAYREKIIAENIKLNSALKNLIFQELAG